VLTADQFLRCKVSPDRLQRPKLLFLLRIVNAVTETTGFAHRLFDDALGQEAIGVIVNASAYDKDRARQGKIEYFNRLQQLICESLGESEHPASTRAIITGAEAERTSIMLQKLCQAATMRPAAVATSVAHTIGGVHDTRYSAVAGTAVVRPRSSRRVSTSNGRFQPRRRRSSAPAAAPAAALAEAPAEASAEASAAAPAAAPELAAEGMEPEPEPQSEEAAQKAKEERLAAAEGAPTEASASASARAEMEPDPDASGKLLLEAEERARAEAAQRKKLQDEFDTFMMRMLACQQQAQAEAA
jgi:hypothetical protein